MRVRHNLSASLVLLVCVLELGALIHHANGIIEASSVCDANRILPFLQIAPLEGLYGAFGTQYSKGLQAAFAEYSRAPSLGDKACLNLMVKNDNYDPDIAVSTITTSLDAIPDLFAVVGVYSTKSALASYQVAVDHKVPFVGGRTGVMTLRKPFQRYVVNFRVSLFDEAASIVEHLLARKHRCIAVFWQDDEVGQAGFDGIIAAMESKRLTPCGQGKHTNLANNDLLDAEISSFLQRMTSSSIIPDAVVLATADRSAAAFVVRAREIWTSVFIGALSCTNAELLVPSLLDRSGPAILEKMVFTQLTPLLTDTSIPLVGKYKEALSALDYLAVPSSVGIEGYLVGRFVTASLDRTNGNFTSEAFLDAFYETGYFNLDAVRCGPLLPSEVDGGCNQCMHQVMLVEPNQDGTLQYIEESPPLRFSTCGYKPYEWTRLVFAQSCSYLGIPGQTCRDFRDGINAAFKQVNDGGGVRGSMQLHLITKDDLDDPEVALQNNLDFLNDPNVFGLIGTSPHMIERVIEEAIARNKSLIGAYTGLASIRVPFYRSVINFRIHHGDESTAILEYCLHKLAITKISVLFENSTLGRDGKHELEEHLADKRLKLHSEGLYNYGDNDLTQAIDSIFFGMHGLPEAVVVVGYDDVLDEILLEAHALDPNIYVFAFSQVVLTELREILGSSVSEQFLQTVDLSKLIFVQTVPVATNLSIPAAANYNSALAKYGQQLMVSPAGLEGFLVGRFVATAVQRVMGDTVSTDTVLDAIYDSGNFNLFGTRCGPLLDETNESNGCNQCMKRAWLTGISNDGLSFHLVDDSFSFTTCMYEPSPNLDFKLDGMRLIMLVFASLGNAFAIAVIGGLVYYRANERIRSSVKFSVISCVGALLFYSSVYLLYFIPTDTTCALEPWLADVSFVMLFGPLFAKTQRLDKIFNNKKMKKFRVSDRHVLLNFMALLLVFMVQLVIWMLVSPRHMVESWTPEGFRYESCRSPIMAFQYLSWLLKALVMLWGCFLCVRVYKISGQFARLNESKEIAISIYNTTLSGLIALVLGLTLQDPNAYFVSFTSLVILNTTMVVSAVYVQPLVAAVRGIALEINATDRSSQSSGSEVATGPVGVVGTIKATQCSPVVRITPVTPQNDTSASITSVYPSESPTRRMSSENPTRRMSSENPTRGLFSDNPMRRFSSDSPTMSPALRTVLGRFGED